MHDTPTQMLRFVKGYQRVVFLGVSLGLMVSLSLSRGQASMIQQ